MDDAWFGKCAQMAQTPDLEVILAVGNGSDFFGTAIEGTDVKIASVDAYAESYGTAMDGGMLDYYDLTTQRGRKGKKKQVKNEERNKQKIFDNLLVCFNDFSFPSSKLLSFLLDFDFLFLLSSNLLLNFCLSMFLL